MSKNVKKGKFIDAFAPFLDQLVPLSQHLEQKMASDSVRKHGCSPAQNVYYEPDPYESFNEMTLVSTRSASTPNCQAGSPSSTSRYASSDTQSQDSRIPRRVQSAASTALLSSVPTPQKRGTFTSVSNCLVTHASTGCGDGLSLDPELDMWLEMIPLSRRSKNFHRDFSDGVLAAEILAHFLPKKVDLHNYVSASAISSKKANWHTLNTKVLSKLGLKFTDGLIENIAMSKPGSAERALRQIHRMIENVDKEQTEIRVRELTTLAASFNGTSLEHPFVEEPCLVRSTPGEVPDCVIYQNIKYFPSTLFDEISKTEEQLRERNNELCNKVRRLETLLSLKENHLQDLTSKIHELRSKYESSEVPNFVKENNLYE